MININKQTIKIYFTDFWTEFDINDNFYIDILSYDYNVIIDDVNPDILFYSCMTNSEKFRKYNCLKIFHSFENLSPKYFECDFSVSFSYTKDLRNLRFPHYVLYDININNVNKDNIDIEREISNKTEFCCLVVSNANCEKRNSFFHKLSKYKQVDSGGKYLNNVGGAVGNKIEFMKRYKFNICFENSSSPGYTTEKIVEALATPTIPIYWGNPLIHFEFNSKSFFNYHDYNSEDELIQDIIEHDKDPVKYCNKFLEPGFHNKIQNQYYDLQRLRKFLVDIIENRENYTPLSKSIYKKYIYHGLGYQLNNIKSKIKNALIPGLITSVCDNNISQ